MPSDSSDRRAARPPQITATDHQEQPALPCPRCESTNTKFCYYNNYNLSQPRHFCKSCRRYWTQGGALRNIPVGGGTRSKAHHPNKRSRTTTTETSASASPTPSSISAPPAPSHVPVSEPDISAPLLSADLGVSGSFSSFLATSSTGFLPLGDPFLNRPGSGLGLGLDGMGLGLGRGVWPGGDVGESGGNTWQLGIGEGLVDGDCFAWPDLAISTPGMGLQ